MKRLAGLLFLTVACIAMGCPCSSDEEVTDLPLYEPFTGTIPASMKGYEMYSWREGGDWTFTLITGTNRLKTHDEITAVENEVDGDFLKVTVRSLSGIKSLLDLVPANQSVAWISDPSRVKGFSMPPVGTVNDIKSHCDERQLDLLLIE